MGFFDGVSKFLGDKLDEGKDRQEKLLKKHESAIKSGRMKQTDQVTGSNSNIPKEPGVYRHVNKQNGAVEYVGQTDDLRVRQQQHARDGKLDTSKQDIHYSVAKDGATKDDLCNTEKEHIKRKKP